MKCTDGHNHSRGGLEMALLQLKDTQLYYEVHGQGQPMVFLSETACDGEVWKLYQVPEFSRDHRVILHDYRGTGRSGKPSIDYSTKMYPQRVEKYLEVRMSNLCPVEFYLRHLIARQSHDTSLRLKDIRVPTLILVGEDDRNVTSDINHRRSSEILAQGIPDSKLVVLSGERHSYFFANPDVAHKTIREFLKSS